MNSLDLANPPKPYNVVIAANGTTRVTNHARNWGEGYAQAAEPGWAALLSGPKTIVETGKPLSSPF